MSQVSLCFSAYQFGMELLIELKVLPIVGPSKRTTAITMRATRARIIEYSTKPWPFSLGLNNIINPFQKIFSLSTSSEFF